MPGESEDAGARTDSASDAARRDGGPSDGAFDGDDPDPLVDVGMDADVADAGAPGGSAFPLPAVNSGEVAWWLMRWHESPSRSLDDQCPEDAEHFGILARDDGQIPGTVGVSFVRDFPCMFWGGDGAIEITYHVALEHTVDHGPFQTIRGLSMRERNNDLPISIGYVGSSVHEFAGSPDTAVQLNRIESQMGPDWGAAYPMVSDGPLDANLAFGIDDPNFERVGEEFQVVLYPDEQSRQMDVSGTDGDTMGLRVRLRSTEVEGIQAQYVLSSFVSQGGDVISCQEEWFQRGIGPYAVAAIQAEDWAECDSLAAASNQAALQAPETHFMQISTKVAGWGIRDEYCLGASCRIE